MQAHLKADSVDTVDAMGKTRRKKVPSALREVIGRNVTERAKVQFKEARNVPMAIREASHQSERERLTKSNIQLIMAGGTSPTLEQLEKLARALDLQPYQLLLPNLDAANPQVARGAVPGEAEVYAIAERVADRVADRIAQTNPKLKLRRREKTT